ncbi:hypothetical protein ACFL4U_04065 [Candidatus Neomarinimicrobiota bacterium]
MSTPKPVWLVRMVMFLAGAVLSNYRDLHRPPVIHYFVGTIFGVVVVIWHGRTVRELIHWRSAAFIAASTAIYVVVRILPDHSLDELTSISEIMAQFWSFILEGFKLVGGVAFHSAVLPIAHALLLGASLKRVLVAIPVTLGVWFKVSLLWLAIVLALPYPIPQSVLYVINYTSIWQMAYLLTMFAFRKTGVEREPLGVAMGELEYEDGDAPLEEKKGAFPP